MPGKIIFGTDGWRGFIEQDVNESSIAEAAQAFSVYRLNTGSTQKRIAVGYDGRKYSDVFAQIFAEVLCGNGIDVILSDRIIPTPVLSFYVKLNGLDSGVMITASHNPPNYNGIKFKASYGGPFLTEETLEIEKLLYKYEIKKSISGITRENLLLPYYHHIKKIIDFRLIKDSGINILVDSMGGAGQLIIEEFLNTNHISCTTIFGKADDNFYGRQAEPIEKNLVPLSKSLAGGEYSLGIATDGDADRVGILLDDGSWLSAQETIVLLGDYLCNKKSLKGNIVKTSSVTDKLRQFESDSGKVLDVQVGFKYICEEMIKGNVIFGCEESGGFGYGFHIPERDGILSGLMIAEILAASGFKKLNELICRQRKEFGNIFYDRIDLEYNKENRLRILPELFNNPPDKISGFRITNIQEFFSSRGIINGIKFSLEGNSRWLLLRSSETEPLIRIYSEADSIQEVKQILLSGEKLISNNF
jgi:phosphomannomutase